MKKLFTHVAFIFMALNLFAQAPFSIGYQAVIRDTTQALLVDTKINMRIQILQGSESGTVVYEEEQKAKTNENGLISIKIGSGTVITGTIGTIDWSEGPYFIYTEIYPTDDISHIIIHTSQIVSVPYALHAAYAENLTGTYTETQGLADVLAVDNNANGQIKNLAMPDEMHDAVNKVYIDIIFWISGVIPLHFADLISDIDGNVYKTITLGTQTWMAENLRTSKLNDNTSISLVTGNTDWAALTTPGYCWYSNVASNSAVAVACGALYNWHTVNTGNLCPTGWHIPTQEEYNTLVDYIGGADVAGGKLKENGTKNWYSPNTLATNLSGFTGLPCGVRNVDGTYIGIGNAGLFWTGTENSVTEGVGAGLLYNSGKYEDSNLDKKAGLSVRCIKD